MTQRASRIAARTFAATFALALPLVGAPAFADSPSTWAPQEHHNFLNYFVLLILIPAGIALTITVLTVLPSIVMGDRYDPTKGWSGMRSDDSK